MWCILLAGAPRFGAQNPESQHPHTRDPHMAQVSPTSEAAYEQITSEFDGLFEVFNRSRKASLPGGEARGGRVDGGGGGGGSGSGGRGQLGGCGDGQAQARAVAASPFAGASLLSQQLYQQQQQQQEAYLLQQQQQQQRAGSGSSPAVPHAAPGFTSGASLQSMRELSRGIMVGHEGRPRFMKTSFLALVSY